MTSFSELGIAPLFIEKLKTRKIETPTDIQIRVIPRILGKEHILFRSATGTGKTFAYLLPVIQNLLEDLERKPGPAALICAPTYELAAQIKKEADFLLEDSPCRAALLTGSANISRQIDTLKKTKPLIIAGNPGRILQLERMGKLKLKAIRYIILDEADRLVSDDQLDEIRELLSKTSEEKIFVACSATLNARSQKKIEAVLGFDTLKEELDDNRVLKEKIEHWALFSEGRQKISTIRSFFAAVDPRKMLVFISRNGQIGNITGQLQHHKIPAAGLYGDMRKQDRKKAIDDFRAGRIRVLVTSDLAARGLDIPDISHVMQLDVPDDTDAYAHRAGRCGRAGRHGVMVTIGDAEELPRLARLEKKLGIAVYPKELYRGKLCIPEVDTDADYQRQEPPKYQK